LNRLSEQNDGFRIPCFAHTLQLVVNDGLKEAKSIKSTLEKVSAIAKLAHTNSKFAEEIESMKVSIPRAVITRWNSQFLVVERILSIPSFSLNEILSELKYKQWCLNKRDLIILQEFVALLSLFAQATTVTQQQKSPSISFIAPSILEIYFDLLNEKKNYNMQVHYAMLYYRHYFRDLEAYLSKWRLILLNPILVIKKTRSFTIFIKIQFFFFVLFSMVCLKFVGLQSLLFRIQQKTDYVKRSNS